MVEPEHAVGEVVGEGEGEGEGGEAVEHQSDVAVRGAPLPCQTEPCGERGEMPLDILVRIRTIRTAVPGHGELVQVQAAVE